MQLNTYLTFKNNARQAMEFYARVLGGEITMMMTMGESPMAADMPKEAHGAIMHACLKVGDRLLMASDSPEGAPGCAAFEGHKGFTLSLTVATPAEGETLFKALSEGGQVTMPLAATFWSPSFGMLVDQFGITWMVNCEPGS